MSVFDMWLESITMTDLVVFGSATLVVFLLVFVRPILSNWRSTHKGSENGT